MHTIHFLDAAEAELRHERRYYNNGVAGLGDEFVLEVQAMLSFVAERPEMYGIWR